MHANHCFVGYKFSQFLLKCTSGQRPVQLMRGREAEACVTAHTSKGLPCQQQQVRKVLHVSCMRWVKLDKSSCMTPQFPLYFCFALFLSFHAFFDWNGLQCLMQIV